MFGESNGGIVPGIKPLGKSHGLLTSIEPIPFESQHNQGGFSWESDCAVDTSSTLLPCPDPVAAKSTDGGLLFCTAKPFTVYGSYKCSTGGRPVSESIAIATERLKRNKERGVERIFWTGETTVGPIHPSLQGGNESCGLEPIDLTPGSGPLNPVAAIAALESNIAECIPGGVGILHMNYGFLPYMADHFLFNDRYPNYFTHSGQMIIAGAGYPGTGPGNIPAAPGETWIFATGPVAVYYSDIFYNPTNVDQAIDRNINNVTFWAEQTFSVIWECCSFAVRVNLC